MHNNSTNKKRFYSLLRVFAGFVALFMLLLMERIGILYKKPYSVIKLYDNKTIEADKSPMGPATCLLIIDSNNATSFADKDEFEQILTDMRIAHDTEDLSNQKGYLKDLTRYETIVYATTDVSVIGETMLRLKNWVADGGSMMFALPLQKTSELNVISPSIGIEDSSYDYAMVDSFRPDKNFMLGGGQTYHIEDGYESALKVGLNDSCNVYATTGDGKVPLIWEKDYKKGKYVVCNFAYCQKAYRGVYAAAYSLLGDVCIYPVINASAYYIDDFPSPVPQGDGRYIERDYHMPIAEFYSSVWWPDMLSLAEKHNFQYTGLIIETYDDKTGKNPKRNQNTTDYYYYGNMLLNRGGELGYHGYNHQPLCGPDYTYKENHGYHLWESPEAMHQGFQELENFSRAVFPETAFHVYVPPSNILSEAGRYMLVHDFPDIKCIASTYFKGKDSYSQEFSVSKDGMIETPRIISGGILDDYMRFAAFSELNFHYVNSHFLHPDDLLDPDRGADLGWKTLKNNLSQYMTWLDKSAPELRHVTGSSMAGAVQRYCMLACEKRTEGRKITLHFKGYKDEAYCFLRLNKGDIAKVSGGKLKKLTGNLYILTIQSNVVTIERQETD